MCTKCQNFFFLKSGTNSQVSCQISEFYERQNVEFSKQSGSSFEIQGCVPNAVVESGTNSVSRCYHHSDTSVTDFSIAGSFVSFCQNYFVDSNGKLKCLQCQPGFALKSNLCLLDCAPHPKMLIDTPANSQVEYITLGVCDTTKTSYSTKEHDSLSFSDLDSIGNFSSPFCTHTSRNFADAHVSSTSCTKCADQPDIIPYIELSAFTVPSATIVSEDQSSFHPLYRNVLGISCLKLEDSVSQIPVLVKNCALYSKENSIYGCTRCDSGFKGIASEITHNTKKYNSFITECVHFPECNNDSLYDGKGLSTGLLGPLNVPLESALSCFECSDSSLNLTYFGTVHHKALVPLAYASNVSSNATLSTGSGHANLLCASKTNLDNIFSGSTLVANCAVYFADVSVAKEGVSVDATSTTSTAGFHCLACKNGFKPTFAMNASSSLRIVTSCTGISNCSDTGRTFNNCSLCATGFAFPKLTNQIDFADCESYPPAQLDPHCLVMDTSSSHCNICKEGFSPNYEGLCDRLTLPYCTVSGPFFNEPVFSSFSTINGSFPNGKDYSLLLPFTLPHFRGCSSCASGFSPLLSNSSRESCIHSANLESKVFTSVAQNKVFIPNCVAYYYDNGNHRCYKCDVNHILVSDHSSCEPVTESTKACSLLSLSDPTKCVQCTSPSVKAGSKCLSSIPKNCLEYVPNDTKEILECTKCVSGYYLLTASNSCLEGSFPYCKEYKNDSSTECTECLSSHMLLTVSGKPQCFYIPHLNCRGLIQTGVSQLACSRCAPFHQLESIASLSDSLLRNQVLDFCFPRDLIAHCISYIGNNSLSSDSTSCVECQPEFYVSSDFKSCIRRSTFVLHCAEYNANNQTCKKCESSYFLEGDQCKSLNDVAQNCKYFWDLNNCQECKSGFYLDKGRCFKAKDISGCSVWRSEDTCRTCSPGSAPSSNYEQCESIRIQNCLVTERFSESDCIECQTGFQLYKKEGLSQSSCVKIEDPNCEILADVSKQECSQCKSNFQLTAKQVCEAVSGSVANCANNSSSDQCQQCRPGFYLSSDRKNCRAMNGLLWHLTDAACEDIRERTSPVCLVCNRGFRDSTGQCLDCSHLAEVYKEKEEMVQLGIYLGTSFESVEIVQNYFELTCDICSSSKCLICKSGYYMDHFGFCRGLDFAGNSDFAEEVTTFANPYDYLLEFGSAGFVKHFINVVILLVLF